MISNDRERYYEALLTLLVNNKRKKDLIDNAERVFSMKYDACYNHMKHKWKIPKERKKESGE